MIAGDRDELADLKREKRKAATQRARDLREVRHTGKQRSRVLNLDDGSADRRVLMDS